MTMTRCEWELRDDESLSGTTNDGHKFRCGSYAKSIDPDGPYCDVHHWRKMAELERLRIKELEEIVASREEKLKQFCEQHTIPIWKVWKTLSKGRYHE